MTTHGARDLNVVLEDQRHYYARRASGYDEAYARIGQRDHGDTANARWHSEMLRLRDAFDRVELHGDVVELAAGTGVWTERIVNRVASLTVLDASSEMLEANRQRLGSAASDVVYETIDLYGWRPTRAWNACVFAFWLAKVPDARLETFLNSATHGLRPGGTVVCVDKTAMTDTHDEYETRTLNDGQRFTIIDHPRPPSRLTEAFAQVGMSVRVQTFGPRFSLTVGARS